MKKNKFVLMLPLLMSLFLCDGKISRAQENQESIPEIVLPERLDIRGGYWGRALLIKDAELIKNNKSQILPIGKDVKRVIYRIVNNSEMASIYDGTNEYRLCENNGDDYVDMIDISKLEAILISFPIVESFSASAINPLQVSFT